MEGGRRFMVACGNIDAARRRQESCYRTPKRRAFKVASIGLVDELKGSCTATRRSETGVALRHVDASSHDALLAICSFFLFVVRALHFFNFLRTINTVIAAWGGEGRRYRTFSCCSLSPAQQTTIRRM